MNDTQNSNAIVPLSSLEKRIRRSAWLTFIALLITLFTLLWSSPLSFVTFAAFGLILMLISILFYLSSLILGGGWRNSEKKARKATT